MLIKTPENKLKIIFVMELNAQTLESYKATLHLAEPIFSKLWEGIVKITSSQLCFLRFLWIAKSQAFMVYDLAVIIGEVSKQLQRFCQFLHFSTKYSKSIVYVI